MKKLGVVLLAAAALGLAGCASPGGTSYFDDASTTMRVKRAIYDDPSLKVMDISVTTVDGVVELSGKVKSRGQGVKAVQVARKVEGVKRVNSQLSVEKYNSGSVAIRGQGRKATAKSPTLAQPTSASNPPAP